MSQDKDYWMVVWSKTTGEYNIALFKDQPNNLEKVSAKLELKNTDYRVIHIGKGNLPPETYRSLEYIN